MAETTHNFKFSSNRRLKNLLLAIAVLFPTSGLLATPYVVAQQPSIVNQFLIDGWERNRENRLFEFDPEYNDDESSAMINLTWIVNRFQHFDYRSASDTANGIVRKYPQALDAWYSKAWLDMREDNIDAGLHALQSYRENLDKLQLEADKRSVHLGRIGRLSGFADGPGNDSATPATLQQTLDKLTEGLSAAERKVFDEQYHATIDLYTNLVDAKENKVQQAITVAVQEQKQELTSLSNESKSLQNERVAIESQADKIRAQTEIRIQELSKQATPLERDADSLSSQMFSVETDIARMQNDLLWAQDRAFHSRDPLQKQIYLDRAARISFTLRDVQAHVYRLRNEMRTVLDQLTRLNNEIAETEAVANQQLRGLNQTLMSVGKQQQRNLAKTKRTAKSPKPKLSQVTSINSRKRFIGSYDPFPTETLRQQLLKYFE